jgi:hypothetical protein
MRLGYARLHRAAIPIWQRCFVQVFGKPFVSSRELSSVNQIIHRGAQPVGPTLEVERFRVLVRLTPARAEPKRACGEDIEYRLQQAQLSVSSECQAPVSP